jgi:hypothetical protein
VAAFNGCGDSYAKDGMYEGWSQHTGCNDTRQVAVGLG